VRHFRAQREFSQEELGDEADLDRTYVSGVERGERNPSLESLLRISDGLGIRLSELAAYAESVKPPRGSGSV
jgi:transcriptional regulator with XRE-family HTH domain